MELNTFAPCGSFDNSFFILYYFCLHIEHLSTITFISPLFFHFSHRQSILDWSYQIFIFFYRLRFTPFFSPVMLCKKEKNKFEYIPQTKINMFYFLDKIYSLKISPLYLLPHYQRHP